MTIAYILVIFFVLPFLLGYLHHNSSDKTEKNFIYYRYFMVINMVIAGFFVAARLFFDGQQAALLDGWPYSPMYQLYSIAIFSMVVMATLTLFSKKSIALAPAILWSVFLTLSSVSHLYMLHRHTLDFVPSIIAHVVYNLAVSVVMMGFVIKLKAELTAMRCESLA